MTSPAEIIETFGMQPHPEGGHYVETYRAPAAPGERAAVTAIYFLLQAGNIPTGTGSMPPKSGCGMRAHPWP